MNKILNFGSLNIDHVYYVDHFVRPQETLASQGYRLFHGGKGLNQSIAVAKAGGVVFHAGKIGPDGAHLAALLRENGVVTRYVDTTGSYTGQAIIQINPQGQNCILLNKGANHEIRPVFVDRVLESFGEGDVLLLQNEINCIGHIMEAAHNKGMRIALNPSPFGPEIREYPLEYVTWFILNEIEGNSFTGETDPERIAQGMLDLYPHARVVQTIGKRGVLYRDRESMLTHGTYKVPVVDTTAAGDTFTGYFITAVLDGKTTEEALRLASVASSITVSREGAAPSIPTMDEVLSSSLELETP